MDRYFAMYHGLTPGASWAVAVERATGSPKVELVMLARTEQEAERYAKLTSVGHEVTTRDAAKTAKG